MRGVDDLFAGRPRRIAARRRSGAERDRRQRRRRHRRPDPRRRVEPRRQDAVGSLLWRGLHPDTEPRTQILMPPLTWSLAPDDAQTILTAVASTIHAGLAVAGPLPAVIAEANAIPPQDLALPPDGALGHPPRR